jgi:hypothetical protein
MENKISQSRIIAFRRDYMRSNEDSLPGLHQAQKGGEGFSLAVPLPAGPPCKVFSPDLGFFTEEEEFSALLPRHKSR